MKFRNKIIPVFLNIIAIAAMMFVGQAQSFVGEAISFFAVPQIQQKLHDLCDENNHLGKATTDQCAKVVGDVIGETLSGRNHYKLRIAEAAVFLPINYISRRLSELGRNNGYSVDAAVAKKCDAVVPDFPGKNLLISGVMFIAGDVVVKKCNGFIPDFSGKDLLILGVKVIAGSVVIKQCNDLIPDFSGKKLAVFGARYIAGTIAHPQSVAAISVWGCNWHLSGIGSLFV